MARMSDKLHVPVCSCFYNDISRFSFQLDTDFFFQVRIAVVGKYTELLDSYLSLHKVHFSKPFYDQTPHKSFRVQMHVLVFDKRNFCVFDEQALLHASVARGKKLVIDWISASDLEQAAKKEVCLHFTLSSDNS